MTPQTSETSSSNKIDFINLLPDELILSIFSFFKPKELFNYSLVSKKWNGFIKDWQLWQKHLVADFTMETIQKAIAIALTISNEDNYTEEFIIRHSKNIYHICSLLKSSIKVDKKNEFLLVCKKLGVSQEVVANYQKYKASLLAYIRKPKEDRNPTERGFLENQNIYYLSLLDGEIGTDGANALAEALTNKNCRLIYLNLEYNNIGDDGANALAKALKDEHCNLKALNLRANYISAAGANALVEALKDEHCKLIYLNLNFNLIGDDGVRELAKAVVSLRQQNRHVTIVTIESNYNFNDLLNEVAVEIREQTLAPRRGLLHSER